MTGRAYYSGDELYVTFTAVGELSDYGVPRSPTWTEWTDIEIESVEILGVMVSPDTLPISIQEAIMLLSEELEFTDGDDYDGPGRSDEA